LIVAASKPRRASAAADGLLWWDRRADGIRAGGEFADIAGWRDDQGVVLGLAGTRVAGRMVLAP
jgi:hypothetical protein